MTHANKIGIAILASTLLVSHVSFAASCYEQSPNYILMGDKYFDLDNNTQLTASDKKIIKSSLKKMVGNWKGKGVTFNCIGPEENPIIENNQFTLSARISTNSSNELHIDIEKFLLDDKTKSQDHLFFFGDANYYRSVSITPNKIVLIEIFRHKRLDKNKSEEEMDQKKSQKKIKSVYEIMNTIEHNKMDFNHNLQSFKQGKTNNKTEEKADSNGNNKGAKKKIKPFHELIHTIEHSKTHFSYNLRRYINGSLAIEEEWQLIRN